MKQAFYSSLLLVSLLGVTDKMSAQEILYIMPEESALHEGTWLQWPHNYTYGYGNKEGVESTWIEMTRGLIKGEKVHIIAYNDEEKQHILEILTEENVSLDSIDFFIYETDDYWVRDNGPVFVYDTDNNLVVTDWGFNGWGEKYNYGKCNVIPSEISSELDFPVININHMILEGGAIEIDGAGTLLATRSSILNDNRNPGISQSEFETYLTKYLGITNFIWLDGIAGLDITDMHIDGFAKFFDDKTIICLNTGDLEYWQVPESDINTLLNATNANGNNYEYIYLPLTKKNVVTTFGENLGYKGSYVNYYIANKVILVPNYNDENDAIANTILQELYPEREVIGIDVRNLYKNGGMIHCITQQQPAFKNTTSTAYHNNEHKSFKLRNYPNPFVKETTLDFNLLKEAFVTLSIYNSSGQKISKLIESKLISGNHTMNLELIGHPVGMYIVELKVNNELSETLLVMKSK